MKFHAFPAVAAALALALPAAFAAPLAFRAPAVAPEPVVLAAPAEKAAAPATLEGGKLKVGDVRALPKAAPITQWQPVEGGFVARIRAESGAARGLRARLDLGTLPGPMEIRVQGDAGPVESMMVDPMRSTEAWTPWTEGAAQLIEVFSPVRPAAGAVRVGALLHFTLSPFAKAASACTQSTACTTGDALLDAQIAERKKSMARISFVSGGSGFVCSATLIDTPRNPAAYVLTANHCIEDTATANSIAAWWFYEEAACGAGGTSPARVQTSGGMQLVFTNYNVDASLLLMNGPPPAGATYAPLNPALLAANTPIVSLSHPRGDSSRWADGVMEGQGRPSGLPYNMYVVNFSRGMIEGGSSGSGAFTRTNGRLELAGVLSRGPLEESCTNTDRFGLYGRLEAIYPQVAQYIGATSPGADDAPNRPEDVTASVSGAPLDLSQPVTLARRIDYAGDVDVFRFTVSSMVAFTGFTTGGQDLVSSILDQHGVGLEANDDAETIDNDTGITRVLAPGTYYFHVAHWTPSATGAYQLVLRADRVDALNYTALWWNEAESGWGININHQGNIVFATLFTYDDAGAPMWLVMSRGDRQNGGSYSGALHRTTGPAFNANPWTAIDATEVGTMRLVFSGPDTATLTYSVNGRGVTKAIKRQAFKTLPECSWSYFDRSFEGNVQDLWWNPAESGWGINLAHQENTLFATLFTYAANGQGLWLVMPEGTQDSTGTYSGALYRTRGPAFDASPWSAIQPTQVGTMSLTFDDGNSGQLNYTVDGVSVSKPIVRQVFSAPRTKCES
jgi:lysyl endopeptidase